MKKSTCFLIGLLLVLGITAAPAWSYPFDSILAFTADLNTPNPSSSIAEETSYVLGVVGPTDYIIKVIDGGIPGPGEKVDTNIAQTSLNGYNPQISWEYALVKVDGPNDGWYLFQDDYSNGGDDFLTTPMPGDSFGLDPKMFNYILKNGHYNSYAISHVTFFGSSPVPEPATIMLFGFGLLGLAGVARKQK